MTSQALAGDRVIRRLAEGVRRPRLVEPILASRPPVVVLSAPSGYGKTVLAAQIADGDQFAATYWVGGLGSRAGIGEAVAALACSLTGGDPDLAGRSTAEVVRKCAEQLGTLSSDASVLVVLDGVDGLVPSRDLADIALLALEAPPGSTLLVTTRVPVAKGLPAGAWLLDATALCLDEGDAAALWRTFSGDDSADDQGALAIVSGGHPAIASVLARRAALLGGIGRLGKADAATSGLIRTIVSSQLSGTELRVLRAAAVLGAGSHTLLAACIPSANIRKSLVRITEVLPLVSCTDNGRAQCFSVSDLVAQALGGIRSLAEDDLPTAERVISELAMVGRKSEALSIALESQITALIMDSIRAVGLELAPGPEGALVRDALAQISPADLAGDPQILIVAAESAWYSGDAGRALRTARLALRMAENVGDVRTVRKAQLAVAGFRVAMGDYEGLARELAPLVLHRDSLDDLDDLGSLTASAMLGFALAGDRAALESVRVAAHELRMAASARESVLARIETIEGLVCALLEGDFSLAYQKFCRVAAYRSLGAIKTVNAVSNAASAALLSGAVEEAARLASTGIEMCGATASDDALMSLLRALATIADSLRGGSGDVRGDVDRAIESELAIGDGLALVNTLTFSAMELLAFDERSAASAYAERAVSAAIDTGSPVITWLAELVQAFCCLAVDDVERARSIAIRVLPQVEAIAAMGHVLHARMILAEVAMRDADLAAAVGHLTAVSDYIIEKSPALIVSCYLRTFPDLMGALVLAMGIEAVPIRVLNLVNGAYEARCLEAASAVLTAAESAQLRVRMGREAERAAAREPEKPEPGICEVRLLGGLQVRTPLGPVRESVWVKRKARIIFAMLVSRCGTDMARGEIIEQLWPEMDEKRGLSNFYVVWSAMKRALQPKGSDLGPFVEHARGVCRLVPGSVVSDLDLFRAASSRARTARASGDCGAELRALLEMVELYRGELLPGDVYTDWFGPVRERFKQDYEAAALRAGYLSGKAGLPHDGLAILRNAVTRNPWREDLYQEIMRLEIATEQRAAAIETYFMCRSRLVEDLGIDPSKETVALYEQVLGMA